MWHILLPYRVIIKAQDGEISSSLPAIKLDGGSLHCDHGEKNRDNLRLRRLASSMVGSHALDLAGKSVQV